MSWRGTCCPGHLDTDNHRMRWPQKQPRERLYAWSHHVIGLNAVDCDSGDSLAKEQVRATGKDEVLKSLDKAASSLRDKLGESLSSLQKFGIPVVEATTPSLEALKAFSLGVKTWNTKGDTAGDVDLENNHGGSSRDIMYYIGLDEQTGDPILHLHHLAHQQVAVTSPEGAVSERHPTLILRQRISDMYTTDR